MKQTATEQGNEKLKRQANQVIQASKKIHYLKGESTGKIYLAEYYYFLGNLKEAMNLDMSALKIAESIGDKKNIAIVNEDIANILRKQNALDLAIPHVEKAIEIYRQIKNRRGLASSLVTLANINLNKEDFVNAEKNYKDAILICEEIKDTSAICTGLLNLSSVYAYTNREKESLSMLKKALALSEKTGNLSDISYIEINIGTAYQKQLMYNEAAKHLLRALEIGEKTRDIDVIMIAHLDLSDGYGKQKNYEQSLTHFVEYTNMKDSIYNEETSKQIQELSKKYETEKKEKQIKLLHTQKNLQEIEIQQSNTIKKGLLLIVALLMVVAVIVYRSYIQKKAAHKEITTQKDEIEAKNEELNQQNEEILTQRDEIESKNHLLEEKNKEVIDSIKYAKRLQDAILTPESLIKEIVPNSFVLFKPKDILSGDFYWFDESDDKIYFAAADCTGHGVPGAFMSIVGYNLLKHAIHEHNKVLPNEILDQVNLELSNSLQQKYHESKVKDGMDISLCCIDKKTRMLYFSGANNGIYLYKNINHSPELVELKADKQPVGLFMEDEVSAFTVKTLQLKEGDTLYLFSDGYPDQFGGAKGKKFKYKQFEDLLYSICDLSIEKQKIALNNVFDNWKGNLEQVDDVLVIGVKV